MAVDPLDGTSLVAYGRGGAIAVMAMAEQGSLFDPGVCVYMDKICVGAEAAPYVDITRSAHENIAGVAMALKKNIGDVEVAILDRPRHVGLIAECREAGARVKLISDGDVAVRSRAWTAPLLPRLYDSHFWNAHEGHILSIVSIVNHAEFLQMFLTSIVSAHETGCDRGGGPGI